MFLQNSEGAGTYFSFLSYFLITAPDFSPHYFLLVLRTVTSQSITEMATQMELCQEQAQVELVNTGTLTRLNGEACGNWGVMGWLCCGKLHVSRFTSQPEAPARTNTPQGKGWLNLGRQVRVSLQYNPLLNPCPRGQNFACWSSCEMLINGFGAAQS